MQDPRAPHYQANPRPARQVAICARRIASSLLIPEADEPNAQVDCFLCDLNHWYANDAEEDSNAKMVERLRNDTRTGGRRRHWD